MLIPCPFTRVLIKTGEPVSIPEGISREEMQVWIAELESRMAILTREVEQEMHPEKFSREQAVPPEGESRRAA